VATLPFRHPEASFTVHTLPSVAKQPKQRSESAITAAICQTSIICWKNRKLQAQLPPLFEAISVFGAAQSVCFTSEIFLFPELSRIRCLGACREFESMYELPIEIAGHAITR
jgi:hypothetical protein